ncbi:DNA polymerase III subunit delta, partial [Candidatus Micrarchaeota archaeon]|nr:DNA polymerase III subunit delta [Candidatus Micrarchaeota archaeon]
REEKALEELLESGVPDGTVLIFTTESVDKRKKIYKKFDKHGRVIELEVRKERYSPGMDKGFFKEQLTEILSRHGKEIEANALDAVYKRTGTDMRQFYAEVEKLVGYSGARKKITVKDVESIYADFHEIAFFDLNKAIRSGDIKASLIALRDNLSVSEHPLQTLGMIANEFRRLILARELLFTSFKKRWKPNMTYNEFKAAANDVKREVSPRKNLGRLDPISMKEYALYNYMKDAQRFQMATLIQIMEMILETDMQLKGAKGGGGDPEMMVERLVMNICATTGKRG